MPDAPSSSTSVDRPTDDAIEIVMPLRAEHAATLRVIVASLGADHGLSIDEIDDLKLAVSEVFTLLIDADGADDAAHRRATTARIRYTSDATSITVELDGDDLDDDLELDALATTILSSVVDEHRVRARGVTLVKRATETSV